MESNDEAINDDRDIDLPILEEGQLLGLKKWDPEQHFTQPPSRYTEAFLVRALEEMGIAGQALRPYNIDNFITWIRQPKQVKHLFLQSCMLVNDLMMEYFPI